MGNNGNMAEVKHICDFGEDEFFEIPPYQRLYEWEEDEIETLLDDIKKACELDKKDEKVENKKEYFIGTITISAKTNEKEQGKENNDKNKVYKLIDGQQRLTTIWFIGFYLASKNCPNWKEFIMQDDKLRIAMPIRDSEENALKALARKITDLKGENDKDKNEKFSSFLPSNIHEKINKAFEYIESWFNQNIKKDDMEKFAKYIYTKVCFVFVTLAENTDLNRFFVRMNNRGKQLEKHEILKARLLDKIKDDKGDEWQKYAKIWDLCSDMDKYIFQSASDRQVLEKDNKDDDKPNGIESMIDFSTFLLHCYKLHSNNDEISIFKDNLLENVKLDSLDCENFIKDILYYRVLFDYFVIKNDIGVKQGNTFKIRRLQSYKNKNSKKYYRLPDDGESATDNSSLKTLATIQNYLRVARHGVNQNYHHWLTPFLKFLSEKVNIGGKIIAWGNFDNFNKIAEYFDSKNNDKQNNGFDDMVKFLENLDTKLATHQLGANNEKSLLDATNSVLKDLKVDLDNDEKKIAKKFSNLENWDFLNQGTKTPHYWFYRLEYYLWKWGNQKDKINNDKIKNIFAKFNSLEFPNGDKFKFEKILSVFYFRNLNSVEHFHPQSLKQEKGWETYIDYFGNLALISSSTNSQYSNQPPEKKKEDLKNKLNKGGNIESLKFFLMCAQCEKDNEWVYNKNVKDKHEEQMIDILIKSLNSKANK